MNSTCKLSVIGLFILVPFLGLIGGCPVPPNNNVVPPSPVTDKGPVVYITVDDATLTVGQTTTGRLWVQQTSPNPAKDNGIFSIAVDVTASAVGIVRSAVPVVFVAPWDTPLVPALTGTAAAGGGITGIATSEGSLPANKTVGTGDPIQFATFQVKGVAVGTVTLVPINYNDNAFNGVTAWDSPVGDEVNYVGVSVSVK